MLTTPLPILITTGCGSTPVEGQQLRTTHGRLQFVLYQAWLDGIEACRSEGLFAGWDLQDVFQILWSRVHGLISLRLQHPEMPWIPVARHLDSVLRMDAK